MSDNVSKALTPKGREEYDRIFAKEPDTDENILLDILYEQHEGEVK